MANSEVWKPIAGYEGIYEASNFGQVRNTKTGNLLKLQNSGNGYFKVNLSKSGKVKHLWVHRLVAKAFVPNPNGLNVVDHVDGNKKNNHASNLEWVTFQENSMRAYQDGRLPDPPISLGEQHPNHTLTEKEVIKIRELYRSGAYTQRSLAKQFGICQSTVMRIVNNQAWKGVKHDTL